jgi:hypothetical protein
MREDKWRHAGATWAPGGGRPPYNKAPDQPLPGSHITDPWELLHITSPPLINVSLIQGTRLNVSRIDGPAVIDSGCQTDLLTALPASTDVQPPWNRLGEPSWSDGWQGSGSKGIGRPLTGRPSYPRRPPTSNSPTSTPLPL